MIGHLDETYLTALQKKHDAQQSNLFDYSVNESNHTRIAVVSEPNDTGILEVTDEYIPELGMPARKLNEFRRLREAYNERDPVKKHNKAFIKCNMGEAYESWVKYNTEAREEFDKLAERLREGEDITLVCFEKPPKKCHRHVLKRLLEERVEPQTAKS